MNQAIKILEKYRSKIESEENRFRKEKNYEWADNNNAVKLLLQKIIDEISSLPSDTQWIESLQRYVDEGGIFKDDEGDYVKYEDVLKLLK